MLSLKFKSVNFTCSNCRRLMKKSSWYPWHIVLHNNLHTIRHMTAVSLAFRHLGATQFKQIIELHLKFHTNTRNKTVHQKQLIKSYTMKIILLCHSLFSPNCLQRPHEFILLLTVLKLLKIQLAVAVFKTRSTQHTTHTSCLPLDN
jgi:hypothetical protein